MRDEPSEWRNEGWVKSMPLSTIPTATPDPRGPDGPLWTLSTPVSARDRSRSACMVRGSSTSRTQGSVLRAVRALSRISPATTLWAPSVSAWTRIPNSSRSARLDAALQRTRTSIHGAPAPGATAFSSAKARVRQGVRVQKIAQPGIQFLPHGTYSSEPVNQIK